MSITKSIRNNSKWLISTNILSQGLDFIIGIVLARLLVPADFGLIVTIQIFTGFVGMVASGGMGQALIRAKDAPEKHFQVVFTIQLSIGLLIYTGFYLIAPWFADWFGEPIYKDLLRVSALSFIIRPFLQMHNNWLQREMLFKISSIRGLASKIISGITGITMAFYGWGVWSLVLSGLFNSVINYIILAWLTPLKTRIKFDSGIARQHSGFGFKIVVNDLISYLNHQTSNFIITKIAGTTMIGLFNKGDTLAKLPFRSVSSPIYKPVFRAMSIEQDNPEKIKYLFFKMISLLLVYTLPFYIGLWWLAEPFIVFLYGNHWADAAIPLQILAPLGLLYCIGHPCGAVLTATNRVGKEIVVQSIAWIIVIFGTYFGLNWGLAGVSFGIVVSQIYSTIHLYFLANEPIKATFKELLNAIFPPLILNGFLVLTLIIVDFLAPVSLSTQNPALYLLLCAILGGSVYATTFIFIPFKSLSPETQRWKALLRLSPS